jgi:uncharacterized membrane protein
MQATLLFEAYIIQIADMDTSKPSVSFSVQLALAGIWGIVCLFILAAPILASHSHHGPAAVFYFSFSLICHQIQDRSFTIFGFPLAVCHRCFGIYVGLLLGTLFISQFIHRSPRSRRIWISSACVPLLFDHLAPYLGLWTSTAYSRYVTGLLFGFLVSSLLVRGVSELLTEVSSRGIRSPFIIAKEAFHE